MLRAFTPPTQAVNAAARYFQFADAKLEAESPADFAMYKAWRDGEGKYDGDKAVEFDWLKRGEAWGAILSKVQRRAITTRLYNLAIEISDSLAPILEEQLESAAQAARNADTPEGAVKAMRDIKDVLSTYTKMQALLSGAVINEPGGVTLNNLMINAPSQTPSAEGVERKRLARLRDTRAYAANGEIIDSEAIPSNQ